MVRALLRCSAPSRWHLPSWSPKRRSDALSSIMTVYDLRMAISVHSHYSFPVIARLGVTSDILPTPFGTHMRRTSSSTPMQEDVA